MKQNVLKNVKKGLTNERKYDIIQEYYGSVVKWLRLQSFTLETWVRFPFELFRFADQLIN